MSSSRSSSSSGSEINVDYILLLVDQHRAAKGDGDDEEVSAAIGRAVDSSPSLRNKKDLIEEFVDSLSATAEIDVAWREFVAAKRRKELDQIMPRSSSTQRRPTASSTPRSVTAPSSRVALRSRGSSLRSPASPPMAMQRRSAWCSTRSPGSSTASSVLPEPGVAVHPSGQYEPEFIPTPDRLTTSLCFAPDGTTAFVTLGHQSTRCVRVASLDNARGIETRDRTIRAQNSPTWAVTRPNRSAPDGRTPRSERIRRMAPNGSDAVIRT